MFAELLQKQQEILDQHSSTLKDLSQQMTEAYKSMKSTPFPATTLGNKIEATSKSVTSKVMSNQGSPDSTPYQIPTKSTKLEFPTFDGLDLKAWLIKAEHFFVLDDTPSHCQVQIAAMHLDGQALYWYHAFTQNCALLTPITWEELVMGLQTRFGAKSYEDPMTDLKELH